MRMYDQFNNPTWTTTTLDTTANSGQYSSLKLNNGYPGIASCTPSSGQGVKYYWKDDSGWHSQGIGSGSGVTYTSLAYNNGNPSIAYHESGSYNDYVMYAYKTSAGWNFDGVNQLGSFEGTGESLAFNNGNPAMSYCDRYTGMLYYATKSGSSWSNNGIKYEQDLNYDSSLAFNNGNPGIAYTAVPSSSKTIAGQNNTHMFDPYPFQNEDYVRAANLSPHNISSINSTTQNSTSRNLTLNSTSIDASSAVTLLTPMSLRLVQLWMALRDC